MNKRMHNFVIDSGNHKKLNLSFTYTCQIETVKNEIQNKVRI